MSGARTPAEPRISTERLCLRLPTWRDAEALYGLFADPEVMKGLNRLPISAVDDARAIIEGMLGDWEADGIGAFLLEATPDQEVVGQAGLMVFDARDWTPSTWAKAAGYAQPELGWSLKRSHWGYGYATEAAAAIRDWAYSRPGIDGIVSLISPDNVRSQRVATRLGAVPTLTVTPAHTRRDAIVWQHASPFAKA